MALIVPSRGRPDNIKRLCEALVTTQSQVDLYVGVDADDDTLDEYRALDRYEGFQNRYNFNLVISPERKKFGPTLNDIAVDIVDDYQYEMFCGDDHEPKTPGWDERYRQELDRLGVGVVYGNDLVMGEKIATQCAWTSSVVKALGYCVPTGYTHLFIDNYFMQLALSIGKLSYLPDVIIQHHHPCAGTAKEDLTYREANSPENWTNDRIRFEKYMAEELAKDTEKLRKI